MAFLKRTLMAVVASLALASPSYGQFGSTFDGMISYTHSITNYKGEKTTELTNFGKAELINAGVPESVISSYSTRFLEEYPCDQYLAVDGIKALYKAGIMPPEANSYSPGLLSTAVIALYSQKILPSDLWVFPSEHAPKTQLELDDKVQTKEKFDQRFGLEKLTADQIISILHGKLKPSEANNYAQRFCARDILFLRDHGVSYTSANEYPDGISAKGVAALFGERIGPYVAQTYLELKGRWNLNLDGEDIVSCQRAGITPQDIDARARQRLIDSFFDKSLVDSTKPKSK